MLKRYGGAAEVGGARRADEPAAPGDDDSGITAANNLVRDSLEAAGYREDDSGARVPPGPQQWEQGRGLSSTLNNAFV